MPAFPSDTHPEVAELQIEMLGKATVAQRIQMMRSLTKMAVRNSKRAIERARPEMTPRERDLFFIELNYGRELADRVRAYWENREP
jgi:hypothetical protein